MAAEWDRVMSPFDAWLFRGDANPLTRSVLTVALMLDRLPERSRFDAAFERASRLILRLRQRVASSTRRASGPRRRATGRARGAAGGQV